MAHFVGIVRDVSDGDFAFRTYDETAAFSLCLRHIVQFAVIHEVPFLHRLEHVRIFAEGNAHDRHQLVGLLHKTLRLRQDDHIAGVALLLEIFQGDGVGHAAVE